LCLYVHIPCRCQRCLTVPDWILESFAGQTG